MKKDLRNSWYYYQLFYFWAVTFTLKKIIYGIIKSLWLWTALFIYVTTIKCRRFTIHWLHCSLNVFKDAGAINFEQDLIKLQYAEVWPDY